MGGVKEALAAIGAVIVIGLAINGVRHLLTDAPQQSRSTSSDPQSQCGPSLAALMANASEMNAFLPMTVGAETEWLNTSAEPCTLIYVYELANIDRNDVTDEALRDVMDPAGAQMVNMACSTPDTRREVLEQGVTPPLRLPRQEWRASSAL